MRNRVGAKPIIWVLVSHMALMKLATPWDGFAQTEMPQWMPATSGSESIGGGTVWANREHRVFHVPGIVSLVLLAA